MLIFQGFYKNVEITEKNKKNLILVVDIIKKLCYNISTLKIIPTRKGSSYTYILTSQWY